MEELSAQRMADALRMDAAKAREKAAEAREEADRLEEQAARWAQGAEGERTTAAALTALEGAAIVVHDRLLEPGVTEVNLDHVVVAASGVFVVDSKSWSGQVSVYESNLWQHLGGEGGRRHLPKHTELDQVSRAAAKMERVLSGPVVPVLCLAAPHHRGFPAQRVRGVDVVPVGALAGWIRDQSSWMTPGQVDSTARRVSVAFPPATGEPFTVPAAMAPSSPPAPRAVSHPHRRRRAARPSRADRPAPRRRRRSAPAAGRRLAVLALGALALWVLLGQLPHLATSAGAIIGGAVTAAGTGPTSGGQPASSGTMTRAALTLLDGSPAPRKPCEGVTTEQVAAALGRPVVPHADASRDQCGWHLEAQTNPYVPPDLTVTTGYAAKVVVQSKGATTVVSSAATGSATVLVPQFTADGSWTVPARAVTQPFQVTYRYAYPSKPTPATITATDAAALAAVLAVARDLAGHLPQGAGADDTTFHF